MTSSPDLLIVGRIATLAGDRGPGWVEAIAVSGGRVVAAGRRRDVEGTSGTGTRRIELAPHEAAIPGLTDAHLHLASAAVERTAVDLAGVETIEGLVARVHAASEANHNPEAVIEGGGWDADILGRWPTADDLERAAPERKVGLWAHDHHALLVSARALRESGVDERADPDGGVIRRDERGRATGILHEKAASLVSGLVPPTSPRVIAEAVDALASELVALGVVAVHDPGGLAPATGLGGAIAAYRSLAREGRLRLRVHACVRPEQLDAAIEAGLRSGAPMGPDPLDRLRLGWLKTFADGSLGSRTAALLEPLDHLAGEPPAPNDGYGVWMTPPDRLREQVARAAANGIATQIHGIGDAAVRAALDALAGTAGATPLMPRVEHAQLVATSDVPRFAELGVAASMQPVHVRSDAEKARRLWGPRAEARGYALAAIARTGAVVVAGTDAPVEPIDPWPGVACAVTRAAPGWPPNTPPFGPENALDLWASLRAWCVAPAVSAGELDRGRLTPGQRADVVVLPAAALAEPVQVDGALWHARPRLVLMDGQVVAER